MLLGGIPGSGTRSIANNIRVRLENSPVAVVQIEDRAFHRYVLPCDVCIACDLNRIGDARSCINCPEALNSRALYDDILAAVDSILKSSQYAQSGGNGLIIVQDRHVLHDAILCNIADCSIWLSQENYDICLIQHLKHLSLIPI